MNILATIGLYLEVLLGWISWAWYVLGFIAVYYIVRSMWIFWRQQKYRLGIDWVLLEILVPRETTRGPKAMDQFLTSVINLRNSPVGPKETYWDGEITRWFSLEIIGRNQVTRLFLRVPRPLTHPYVSSFYAQYPDIEIVEVPSEEDYINDFPPTYQSLKVRGYEMYGMEIAQRYNPGYMLRTYKDFETMVGDEKGRILDPMAVALEIIGKAKPDETVWIQFLLQPDTKGEWVAEANKAINKIKDAVQGGEHGESAPDAPIRFRFRTQAEEKTLKGLEDKKGKAVYKVLFRTLYIAPKTIYNRDLVNRGVMSYLAQMDNDNQRMRKINKIRSKVDWDTFPYLFPQRRLFWKRVVTYDEYRRRFIPEETMAGKIYNSYPLRWCFWHKPMILCAEEIATFFHIPTNVVLTQVTMERIESRRLPPPSNLPS